jgi:hypothetical protein
VGHSTVECLTVNRACRGQNLEDVLLVDDLARHCRGAMTPREAPEKLAVLLQLAVLMMVLLMVAVLPMVQLA